MADIKLDPANVPSELHPLIPYAEKWGIRDEKRRAAMLREAPLSEIEALCETLYPLWDNVVRFMLLRPDFDAPPSLEVEVFDSFYDVLSDVYNILSDHNPKKLLEIIDFPEAWPPMQFDPAQIPPALHSLIPYAKKWVIADEGVRSTVIKASTNAEIQELLSEINQLDEPQIREILSKMFDSETQKQEAYVIALLLDVGDQAEHLLKERNRNPD